VTLVVGVEDERAAIVFDVALDRERPVCLDALLLDLAGMSLGWAGISLLGMRLAISI
jgi:hypothetical protein